MLVLPAIIIPLSFDPQAVVYQAVLPLFHQIMIMEFLSSEVTAETYT